MVTISSAELASLDFYVQIRHLYKLVKISII